MTNRNVPAAILATAALFSGGAALAAANPAKPPATKAVAVHRTTTTHMANTRTTTTAPAGKARLVTAKLANGKTVTYNCALAGNATKQACK